MKRTLIILLAAAMLLGLLGGCKSKKAESVEYIGIISAMDNEIALLLSEAKIDHVDTIGNMEYHVGELHGQPVVITRAGIGKVRVSSGVTAMLNRYDISEVIFTGIAGGVADETQVLDVVIAMRLVEHDYGFITNDGFVWTSGDPGIGREPGEYYLTDSELAELAYEAAVEVVGESHAFKGTIATGDQFIASEDYVRRLKDDYGAYACEMEGASVAVVCINYNVPFVVIRTLSDKADGAAHESYANMMDIAGEHSNRIVLKMLDEME